MSGITLEHVAVAERWLIEHDHSLAGIAHPEGGTARFMAAVALELNVPAFSDPAAAALVVDLIAYGYSDGRVVSDAVRAFLH